MTQEEAVKHFESWAKCNYAPTRNAALMALSALTPPTQEQVERVFGGHWVKKHRISGGFGRKSGIDDMGGSAPSLLMSVWSMTIYIARYVGNKVQIISLISAPPAAWP